MTFRNEDIKKLEALAIALVLPLKDIKILNDSGISNTPTVFTFALNKSIKQIEISYDENLETDGYYSYSVYVDIPF
jgi:hypothetical protein